MVNLLANICYYTHSAVMDQHKHSFRLINFQLWFGFFSTSEGNPGLQLLNVLLCSPASCKLCLSAVWCWAGSLKWDIRAFFTGKWRYEPGDDEPKRWCCGPDRWRMMPHKAKQSCRYGWELSLGPSLHLAFHFIHCSYKNIDYNHFN